MVGGTQPWRTSAPEPLTHHTQTVAGGALKLAPAARGRDRQVKGLRTQNAKIFGDPPTASEWRRQMRVLVRIQMGDGNTGRPTARTCAATRLKWIFRAAIAASRRVTLAGSGFPGAANDFSPPTPGEPDIECRFSRASRTISTPPLAISVVAVRMPWRCASTIPDSHRA
jgi:hypothetical protein